MPEKLRNNQAEKHQPSNVTGRTTAIARWFMACFIGVVGCAKAEPHAKPDRPEVTAHAPLDNNERITPEIPTVDSNGKRYPWPNEMTTQELIVALENGLGIKPQPGDLIEERKRRIDEEIDAMLDSQEIHEALRMWLEEQNKRNENPYRQSRQMDI